LIGICGAYALSSIAPHTNPGGGRGRSGPSPHIDPIFIPRDLVHVWLLSLLLSVAAGIMPAWKASRLSPLFGSPLSYLNVPVSDLSSDAL